MSDNVNAEQKRNAEQPKKPAPSKQKEEIKKAAAIRVRRKKKLKPIAASLRIRKRN
jgi:hypothetical protein